MKWTIAAFVGVLAVVASVSAQDEPAWPKPLYTSDAMLKRIGSSDPSRHPLSCAFRDATERAVNTTVDVDGSTYRCVQVLDSNLQPTGLGWVRMPAAAQQPAGR
jgi:hypothetical protein